MIALDTSLLVYAHRADTSFHEQAASTITRLAESPGAWAIPWPCVHEFLAIVTHPRVFAPPTPIAGALDQLRAWLESPSVALLSESESYATTLVEVLGESRVTGPKIHDARVAALCLHHGIDELWTADRDFGRFPRLRTRNPLA